LVFKCPVCSHTMPLLSPYLISPFVIISIVQMCELGSVGSEKLDAVFRMGRFRKWTPLIGITFLVAVVSSQVSDLPKSDAPPIYGKSEVFLIH